MQEKNENTNGNEGISRSSFLKRAAAVGAVAAVSATLPLAAEEKKADAVSGATAAEGTPGSSIGSEGNYGRPWEKAPAPIPANLIRETIDADVVVVGAALAGLSAAVSAAERRGTKVVVVEKTGSWVGRGGGIGVVESRFTRKNGIKNDKKKIAREWMALCGNRADEKLVWLFLNNSGEAMDWFLDKADREKLSYILWDGYYRGDTYTEYPGYHMFMGGPQMKAGKNPAADCSFLLYNEAVKLGVQFLFEAPGQQLIRDAKTGRVQAVIVKDKDGYKRINGKKGVILATGDIGGSPEMLKAYAPIALKANESQYAPVGVNTGDGHKMGMWVGGAIEDTPFPTMIHPQAFAWLNYSSLFVNQRGERYMNEDSWVQAKTIQAMLQPGKGAFCYSIIDANWPQVVEKTIPYGGGMFWDSFRALGKKWTPDGDRATMEGYIKNGKFAWRAETLDELAAKIGVPAAALKASVARYNELAKAKDDADFGKRKELLYSLEKGPFIALKFGGALLAVCGGLLVDDSLRVLDKDRNPIEGLYAVGNVSGGLYGVDYPIAVPGNSHGRALTWGYLAGRTAAKA